MRKDIPKEQEETLEVDESSPKQEQSPQETKVYIKPMCVSVEEMFNVINEKLDILIQAK